MIKIAHPVDFDFKDTVASDLEKLNRNLASFVADQSVDYDEFLEIWHSGYPNRALRTSSFLTSASETVPIKED